MILRVLLDKRSGKGICYDGSDKLTSDWKSYLTCSFLDLITRDEGITRYMRGKRWKSSEEFHSVNLHVD